MRRGFVLLAVMIGLALALVTAAALLQFAQAETAGAHHSTNRAQSYALARSGIDALAGRLAEQREDILRGLQPQVESQYVIYEAGNRLGVVRLLPVGASGRLLESESSKLDINEVTAEQLVATGLVEEALAQRIIQYRDKAKGEPIRSLNELAHVPGMTNALLFGSLERLQQAFASLESAGDEPTTRLDELRANLQRVHTSTSTDRALIDVLTVYSIEADLRMDGEARYDLSTPFESEEEEPLLRPSSVAPPEEQMPRDLDPSIPAVLRPLVARGSTYTKPSEVAGILRQNNVAPQDWPEYFETCTTQPRDLRHGRIDINTAPIEALLVIPGLTPEHAEAIAAAQDSLSEAERATVCWPLLAGIIEEEPFSEALDSITNRSWSFRVRIAAGEVSSDEPEGPLDSPVVFEMVFDLASPAPRVAYLRDMTLLPTMLTLADRNQAEGERFEDRFERDALDDELRAWDEAFGEKQEPESDRNTLPGAASLPDRASLPDFATPPTSLEDSPTDSPSTARDEDETESAAAAPPPPPVRRIGRWSSASTE